ncbi:hypothetical protein WDV86_16070, partial [Pseudokineococcus sp. 1T1Z-3]|uniref:hypothetical protein n=1 Tax=Pseudokineococcus sp. 1T1Z-3 TaxID=3132745 RepID=UPI003098F1D7
RATRTVEVVAPLPPAPEPEPEPDEPDEQGPAEPQEPEGPTVLASDDFERAVTSGWGSAATGGAWTTSGTASSFSVEGGRGRIFSERVGVNRSTSLPGVSSTSTELLLTTSVDTTPTGGGTYFSVIGRQVSARDDYRAKIRYQADGRVVVYLVSRVDGRETVMSHAVVPGATAANDQPLEVRFRVTGQGTTDAAVKVWPAGTPEPSGWTAQASDSAAVLQAPGGIGFLLYVSGSGSPATARVAQLEAVVVQ